jgi:hypothetical protein
MTSAFITHSDKVLGHYSTASWLRQLVLAMWNGDDYQVGLSKLASIDNEHFSAALAMIQSYHQYGESDQAFMNLAAECQKRVEAEKAAYERAARLDAWCNDTRLALRHAGARSYYVDDHYEWFERQFDAGVEPAAAAKLALASNLYQPAAG